MSEVATKTIPAQAVGGTKRRRLTCPKCGYERNSVKALKCGLCGSVFPHVKHLPPSEPRLADDFSISQQDWADQELLSTMRRRDFAREIETNKKRTVILLAFFPLLIVAMGWAIGTWMGGYTEIGVAAAIIVAVIYSLVSWFSGDTLVLKMAGARPAMKALDARLVNVVEEMRLASGLPMPKVYVIDTDGMNAFATGRDPQHASIAVTRGLIEALNREELQAVVAHELGHVKNFDIRYAMLVAAMVGAIVLLADGLRRGMFWGFGGGRRRSGGGKGGGVQIIMILVAVLLALFAPLFARMVQMSISRKREFLADATAVQFTRNPLALASALEKIDMSFAEVTPEMKNRALQHLYITNPIKSFNMDSRSLFSTHPPIEARVRLLKAMA